LLPTYSIEQMGKYAWVITSNYRSLHVSDSRSEIPKNFGNVVLEKDGEDQLDRSYEKWRSIFTFNEQSNIPHEIR
jgi:hypothetical protein